MLYGLAMLGFSLTSMNSTPKWAFCVSASSSRIGAIFLQGMHVLAPRSTSRGKAAFATALSATATPDGGWLGETPGWTCPAPALVAAPAAGAGLRLVADEAAVSVFDAEAAAVDAAVVGISRLVAVADVVDGFEQPPATTISARQSAATAAAVPKRQRVARRIPFTCSMTLLTRRSSQQCLFGRTRDYSDRLFRHVRGAFLEA
jgi:hypothetical protein